MSPDKFHIHSAQLTDAWLSRLALTENPAFTPGAKVSYGVDFKTRVETDNVGGQPLGHLDLVVQWLDDENQPTAGPFDLEISVTGEFDVDEPTLEKREAVERWIDLNATHLLWTYARTYVSALTSFTRHAPLTLFTITIPHPRALDPETGDHAAVEIEDDDQHHTGELTA